MSMMDDIPRTQNLQSRGPNAAFCMTEPRPPAASALVSTARGERGHLGCVTVGRGGAGWPGTVAIPGRTTECVRKGPACRSPATLGSGDSVQIRDDGSGLRHPRASPPM